MIHLVFKQLYHFRPTNVIIASIEMTIMNIKGRAVNINCISIVRRTIGPVDRNRGAEMYRGSSRKY